MRPIDILRRLCHEAPGVLSVLVTHGGNSIHDEGTDGDPVEWVNTARGVLLTYLLCGAGGDLVLVYTNTMTGATDKTVLWTASGVG